MSFRNSTILSCGLRGFADCDWRDAGALARPELIRTSRSRSYSDLRAGAPPDIAIAAPDRSNGARVWGQTFFIEGKPGAGR